jgi:hypothetical protein
LELWGPAATTAASPRGNGGATAAPATMENHRRNGPSFGGSVVLRSHTGGKHSVSALSRILTQDDDEEIWDTWSS